MNELGLPTINNVKGFVEVPETMSWMRKLGNKISWKQADDFIAVADQKLELNGELVEYIRENGITWTPVPDGTATNLPKFLNSQSKTGLYQGYSEITQSGCRYTILVDYQDNSDAINADEDLKRKVIEMYRKEIARHIFLNKTPPDIESILTSLTYKTGLPRKMKTLGFLISHIKSVS